MGCWEVSTPFLCAGVHVEELCRYTGHEACVISFWQMIETTGLDKNGGLDEERADL